MNISNKAIGVITALTLVIAAAVWVDTRPYLTARSESAALESAKKNLEQDMARTTACVNLETLEIEHNEKSRSCLIDAMQHTKSALGTYYSALKASFWLRDNPDDQDIRAAALSAISNARSEMLGSNKPYYDFLFNQADAHDRSIIFRIYNGRKHSRSQFEKDADDLDQIENAVMLPELARSQSQWRMQAQSVIFAAAKKD